MSSSEPQLADPQRKLPLPEWYQQNSPHPNRISWQLHLGVKKQIIDDFIPQVRAALHEAALGKRPVTRDSPGKSLRIVTEQLARRRPDLFCPSLPFKAFAEIVRSMALKYQYGEPTPDPDHSDRTDTLQADSLFKRRADEDISPNKKPEKQPRLVYKSSSFTRPNVLEEVNIASSLVDEGSGEPTQGNRGINAASTTRDELVVPDPASEKASDKSVFEFDPDLVTVSFIDSQQLGNVQIVRLKSINNPHENYDIHACNFAIMEALEASLGPNPFNLNQHSLWCKVDDIEHEVQSQEVFEILCRWQVEDSLAKNPRIPPRIRFEKRPVASNRGHVEDSARDTQPQIVTTGPSYDHRLNISSIAMSSFEPSPTPEPKSSAASSGQLVKKNESSNSYHMPRYEEGSDGPSKDPDSDSDRPLVRVRKEEMSNFVNDDEDGGTQSYQSSSPLSAVIVLSQPLSQRKASKSQQLLESFRGPPLPTPSTDTHEVTQSKSARKRPKKKAKSEKKRHPAEL